MWVSVHDGTSQSINVYNNNLVMAAGGGSNGYNKVNFPGFVQNTSATNPNWSVDNNYYVVEGEIYMAINSSGNQGAAARIEIGDASTYAACSRTAHCTVESPGWWTSTSVQFRQRDGVFSASGLSGLYLYYSDYTNATTLLGRFT
jgi:hypothetical protein